MNVLKSLRGGNATSPTLEIMKYLYIVKCQNFYKIGVAADVHARIKTMQTGNPFDITEEFKGKAVSAKTVEKKLHEIFSRNRVRGEWYFLTDKDLKFIADFWEDKLGLTSYQQDYIRERTTNIEIKGKIYKNTFVNKLAHDIMEVI